MSGGSTSGGFQGIRSGERVRIRARQSLWGEGQREGYGADESVGERVNGKAEREGEVKISLSLRCSDLVG